MADFTKALTNPYVLGGGALIGVILLMSGNRTASNGGATVTPGFNSVTAAYNMEAMKATTEQARISADYGKHMATMDVAKHVAVLSTVKARDDNLRQVRMQQLQSNEGIIKTQLQTQAAVTIDIMDNLGKMHIAGLDVQKTVVSSNASVQIAKIQAKAQKDAAKWGAIGDIAGAVTDVASMFVV